MSEVLTRSEFEARMKERHRPAFELWRSCHEMLEGVVPKGRDLSSPFARALDILFVQAFKSHGSLGLLSLAGQGEDGATVARRMLEIAFQSRHLCAEVARRDERGKKYLAWYWAQAPIRLKADLPPDVRTRWQSQYDRHKRFFLNRKGKRSRNWWGDSTMKDLATKLRLVDTYDQDYGFLSQIAHCTAQGFFLERRGGVVEVRTTGLLIRAILIFGTRYMLTIAQVWQEHFGLLDGLVLAGIADQALKFDWQAGDCSDFTTEGKPSVGRQPC